MKPTPVHATTAHRPARRTVPVLALSLVLLVTAGCDRATSQGAKSEPATKEAGKDEHGHDHSKEEKPGEHDEHGHAHGGHEDEVKLTEAAVRRNGIRLGTAKRQVLTATLSAPARVAFNEEQIAHVGSAVTGRVSELRVKTGDPVNKGDVLLVIDSPELGEAQSDYLQKRTSASVAAEAIELSKSSYERAKKLYEKNQGTSLNEVQKREAELNAAAGAAATAKSAATSAANKLSLLGMTAEEVKALETTGTLKPTYTVRSPIAGQVTEREVTLGELVSPEKERLLTVADLSTVWVVADVPEARLPEIAEGSKVQIETASGGASFEGSVAYIAPELDPTTRTGRVRVQVPNPEKRFRPGMFARAEIATGVAGGEPVVAVPEEAVQTVEGEPALFVPVKGEPNTFAKRQVGVGPAVGGMVPVFAGLKDGEQYVATGSFVLKADLGKAGAAHEH